MAIHRAGPEDGPLASYHCTTCDNDAHSAHSRIPLGERLLPISPAQPTSDEIAELNAGDHDKAYPHHRILIHRFSVAPAPVAA